MGFPVPGGDDGGLVLSRRGEDGGNPRIGDPVLWRRCHRTMASLGTTGTKALVPTKSLSCEVVSSIPPVTAAGALPWDGIVEKAHLPRWAACRGGQKAGQAHPCAHRPRDDLAVCGIPTGARQHRYVLAASRTPKASRRRPGCLRGPVPKKKTEAIRCRCSHAGECRRPCRPRGTAPKWSFSTPFTGRGARGSESGAQ